MCRRARALGLILIPARWDSITVDGEPVAESLFRNVEAHYTQLSQKESIDASPFEILTATAFHIFNELRVQVGVVEVGMGGKLDATNILNNQVVSVICKIARDHQAFLGDTLEDIAGHKAGILRPDVPFLVNPMNDKTIQNVIDKYAQEIGAGPRMSVDTMKLRVELFSRKLWHRFAGPLEPFQRDNAILGMLAAQEAVRSMGMDFDNAKILKKLLWLSNRVQPARLEQTKVPQVFGRTGRRILVDGAHNPDAAITLEKYVLRNERHRFRRGPGSTDIPQGGWPVTWVLAMTEGKNVQEFLRRLLRPGDNVIATAFDPVDGMPWVKPVPPERLLLIARAIEPSITGLAMPKRGALRAIFAASFLAKEHRPIVLTGSLYLCGDFHRDMRYFSGTGLWTDAEEQEKRQTLSAMEGQERNRVNAMLSVLNPSPFESSGTDKKEPQDRSAEGDPIKIARGTPR